MENRDTRIPHRGCGGSIIKLTEVHHVQDGPVVFGPGNRTREVEKATHYCDKCGSTIHPYFMAQFVRGAKAGP